MLKLLIYEERGLKLSMDFETQHINNDNHEESENNNTTIKYEAYYNNVLLKEQPFYRKGMDRGEVNKEIEYLNNNLQSFYNGNYIPLWKQEWLK